MDGKEIQGWTQLILYGRFKNQALFEDMCKLLLSAKTGETKKEQPDAYQCANRLIELAVIYGFEGNLWHCFLVFCMATHENAYSTSCEMSGRIKGSLYELAAHDFQCIHQLFTYDIECLEKEGECIWKLIKNYRGTTEASRVFNKKVRDRLLMLAFSLEQAETGCRFQEIMTEFYQEFGVGKFGLNEAFRMKEAGGKVQIEPITNIERLCLEDLVGYELQKEKLIANTEAFIEGKAANNVLLYGDSGTGKSSSIKAILNQYYHRGLRMIEIYKHQFQYLSDVLEQIKDRNYKFIIYMDDLSFEEYEIEYKYLKAVIEGGLGKKPENVLIYATSNRRHLIRESFHDKPRLDDDLHVNDTVQEKLSLVARFGITIYYGAPDKRQFQEIVKALAEKYQVYLPEEELYLEANRWELSHGGLSGRTAAQFMTYLLGKTEGEGGEIWQ